MSDLVATLIVCAICVAVCAILKARLPERLAEWIAGMNDRHLEKVELRRRAERRAYYASLGTTLRARQLERFSDDHKIS